MAQGSALIAALRGASPANEAQPQANSFQTLSFPWQQNRGYASPSAMFGTPATAPKQSTGLPSISEIKAKRLADGQSRQGDLLGAGQTTGGNGDYDDSSIYDRTLDTWIPNPAYPQPTYEDWQPPVYPWDPAYKHEDIGGTGTYDDSSVYDRDLDTWVPNPAYEPPAPAYQPPAPTYEPPAPTYQPPAPAYQEPAYEPPQQTYEEPVYDEVIEPEWYYDSFLDMWLQQQ